MMAVVMVKVRMIVKKALDDRCDAGNDDDDVLHGSE